MTDVKTARIWEETVRIPTYPPPSPDPNPMFFENRVNQGASGRIYPNPFTDRVNHETKIDQDYTAVFLENEYIQLMVLPRFGGRIHAALDKTNGYDFIYRQHVIKPALIGLFGSWLSGGMEFNWPLHHRPSTFMPVEYEIQPGEAGSVTLWMSEHEPMNRMKGMVGVCLYPGVAYFELKVQLFNRTDLPQPFLWWVNTAVHVNENYQLIFPPDVESVTYHSRAYMASYPVARGIYAGLDWTGGVDISWPKNVNQATSYFANPSKFDFFGGYDHGIEGGVIHVANHHISPGKKLFTWGTGDFGTGWQESLTDEDGPYIELMASAYSDNQPDFAWIQPYETKTFSQIWYPIQKIGTVKAASRHLALNLDDDFVGLCATEALPGSRIIITQGGATTLDERVDLEPGNPYIYRTEISTLKVGASTVLRVLDASGVERIHYAPPTPKDEPLPETAKPPKLPHQIDSLEELYLTGLHVEQYLHFSLDPASYWERALEIDPGDSRSNNNLGRLLLRRGDFSRAESLFRQAIKTLTQYNYNPYDGEVYYNLGLALSYQGRFDEAYETTYKATWSYAWASPGYFALAKIDTRRGDYRRAIEHLDRSLATNQHNNKACALKAAALRCMGQYEAALKILDTVLEYDPLDHWAHAERLNLSVAMDVPEASAHRSQFARIMRNDVQNYLDLSFDYARAGLFENASSILASFLLVEEPGAKVNYPMIYYSLGYFAAQMEDQAAALDWYTKGAEQPPDWCFPVRLEEQIVLEAVRAANPDDGRAAYYLGNLYYDKKQYQAAIQAWQAATELEPGYSIPWRNLGIALYNKGGDKVRAKQCYTCALAANPEDPRLVMEMDQLLQRTGASQVERLDTLEAHADLVRKRDDLSITFAELYSQANQAVKALDVLKSHRFHAWEGGEGGAAGVFALAHVTLGRAAREDGDQHLALEHFLAAQNPPDNLGVGHGMSLYDVLAWFNTAETFTSLGDVDAARGYYQKVIEAENKMSRFGWLSPLTYYAAASLHALGLDSDGVEKLKALMAFAQKIMTADHQGGFYTSKPAMIVFDDDPQVAGQIQGNYLMGLAHLGLGDIPAAADNFKAVLKLDPHHWGASFQMKLLDN